MAVMHIANTKSVKELGAEGAGEDLTHNMGEESASTHISSSSRTRPLHMSLVGRRPIATFMAPPNSTPPNAAPHRFTPMYARVALPVRDTAVSAAAHLRRRSPMTLVATE
jgi:hypothetical protein